MIAQTEYMMAFAYGIAQTATNKTAHIAQMVIVTGIMEKTNKTVLKTVVYAPLSMILCAGMMDILMQMNVKHVGKG